MEIVKYDEEREVLHLRFSTRTVWKYCDISKEMYESIANAESPRRAIRNLFHNSCIVGVVKEDT